MCKCSRFKMPVSICSACLEVSEKSKNGAGASTKVLRNCSRCSSLKIPALTSRVVSFEAIPRCIREDDELPSPPESRIFIIRRAMGFGNESRSGNASIALLASSSTSSAEKPMSIPERIDLWTSLRRLFSRTRSPRRSNSPGASAEPRSRAPSTGPGANALIWISGPRCRERISASTR